MNSKIQLCLADAAQHEFGVFTNVLWAFGALLAASKRLVGHLMQQMPNCIPTF
jgi:hypothetical protein